MASRRFSSDDLLAFANLSGDHNPLHVDAVHARRLVTGAQTVHGVFGLLWALDAHLVQPGPVRLTRLSARFRKPIRAGDLIESSATSIEGGLAVSLKGADGERFSVTVGLAPAAEGASSAEVPPSGPALACRELSFAEAAADAGALPLFFDPALAHRLFPNLGRIPPRQMAILLASTRLIGMVCPGLHSIFSDLELDFTADAAPSTELGYRVTKGTERLGLLAIELTSGGARGAITALFRPAPRQQIHSAELTTLVKPGEFSAQRALVVGGSRGLGEVMAKLVAAGGGEVQLTYRVGKSDAERVVTELQAHAPSARCLQLDVLEPLLALKDFAPTHLYYFATPLIEANKGGFSSAMFERFCTYYVSGFQAVVHAVRALGAGPLEIFFPSTVFLDQPEAGMAEYAAAKAAGEALGRYLQARLKNTRVHLPRLPRLSTDQTSQVGGKDAPDPAPALLAALRQL